MEHNVLNEKNRRAADTWMKWTNGVLLGVLLTGSASYFAMWGAFSRGAISRADVEVIMKAHSDEEQKIVQPILKSNEKMAEDIIQIRIALESLRIKTGVDWGNPEPSRKKSIIGGN